MEKLKKSHISRTTRKNASTYLLVIAAFAILQILRGTGSISSILQGLLVPICAYVVMAATVERSVRP